MSVLDFADFGERCQIADALIWLDFDQAKPFLLDAYCYLLAGGGNPSYSVFVQALEEIGARDAARYLAEAVAAFPGPNPHLDLDARREFLESIGAYDGRLEDTVVGRVFLNFEGECDRVYDCLIDYAMQNVGEFSALAHAPPRPGQ